MFWRKKYCLPLHFNPLNFIPDKGLVFSLVEKYRQGIWTASKLSDQVVQDVSEVNCRRMQTHFVHILVLRAIQPKERDKQIRPKTESNKYSRERYVP